MGFRALLAEQQPDPPGARHTSTSAATTVPAVPPLNMNFLGPQPDRPDRSRSPSIDGHRPQDGVLMAVASGIDAETLKIRR